MGKYAVITLNFILNNDELYSLLRQVCVPSIRAYAKRMRYDFILMNNNTDKYTFKTKQLQCLDFLDYYDKILYIDGDCYIHKLFCIDLFNKTRNKNMGITFNTTSTYHAKKGGGGRLYKIPFCHFYNK